MPSPSDEFEQNMRQLSSLLKKIIPQLPGVKGKNNLHLNVSIFAFLPTASEEMEEMEEGTTELSPDDIEFLKRHGLQF